MNIPRDIIKVLVILGEKSDGNAAYKKSKKGKLGEEYGGFIWDVWTRVREKLEDKYDFVVEFTDEDDHNYDGLVTKVHKGEYDMVVGGFFRTLWREKRIDYLTPIAIDANSVIHIKRNNVLANVIKVIKKTSVLVLYLFIAGIIVGLLAFYLDPGRARMVDLVKNKKLFFIRSILTGIATMLGEMGFMSENASLKPVGVILSVVVMITSFIFVMFVQGAITRLLIDDEDETLTKDNIAYKPILGFEGYATVEKLKRYGAQIDTVNHMPTTKLLKKYLDEQDKYAGVTLTYLHAYPHAKKNTNLVITSNFGDEPIGYIVSQSKPKFKEDMNSELLKLRALKKNGLRDICRKYFTSGACKLT
tara:strand:+ start:690 stop:1769 length:1080 start_codon:yes stop_codon:yes gene_type:complete